MAPPNMALWCCCVSCIESLSACTHCDDVTPQEYTLTLSGFNLCSGCIDVDGGLKDAEIEYRDITTLNDVFTLSQRPGSACVWELTIEDAIRVTSYNTEDGSCGLPVVSSPVLDLDIQLVRSASQWDLTIASPGSAQVYLFSGSAASNTSGSTELCADVPSIGNDYASGDCGSIVAGGGGNDDVLGYGGTATIECVS